ncbi:hypothetical protein [Catenulispora sp. MAP12-49]|uniref:aromatic-ring hydroxylase C-terminal domain-containing protein n=1 Tax=Catenulispora sp. MAP12-49 TaxID=3156302 RepID=UPI003519057F
MALRLLIFRAASASVERSSACRCQTPNRSTLDAVGEWFTVLTPDPTGWGQQITGPWPLRIESLPAEHADSCGLRSGGALLVRPDGHIAARWQDRPSGDSALYDALVSISGYR